MNKLIAFGRSLNLLKCVENSTNTKKNQYNPRKLGRRKRKTKKNKVKPGKSGKTKTRKNHVNQ